MTISGAESRNALIVSDWKIMLQSCLPLQRTYYSGSEQFGRLTNSELGQCSAYAPLRAFFCRFPSQH